MTRDSDSDSTSDSRFEDSTASLLNGKPYDICFLHFLQELRNTSLVGRPAPLVQHLSGLTLPMAQQYQATNTSDPVPKTLKSITVSKTLKPITVSLIFPRVDLIKEGDMFQFRITCRHDNGTVLETGGDFWFATLTSSAKPKASTAGRVVDNNNGTYDVYLYAGWSGKAQLKLTRVLNREAVIYMNSVVWPAVDRMVWQGHFKIPGKSKSVVGLCKLRKHGNWTGMCEYPHPKALGKTVFICDKPPGANCNSFHAISIAGKIIIARAKELDNIKESLFSR